MSWHLSLPLALLVCVAGKNPNPTLPLTIDPKIALCLSLSSATKINWDSWHVVRINCVFLFCFFVFFFNSVFYPSPRSVTLPILGNFVYFIFPSLSWEEKRSIYAFPQGHYCKVKQSCWKIKLGPLSQFSSITITPPMPFYLYNIYYTYI